MKIWKRGFISIEKKNIDRLEARIKELEEKLKKKL